MNVVVNPSFTSRLLLGLGLGFVALGVSEYLRQKRSMEDAEVIENVELFLRRARLDNLIQPVQQEIIDGIQKAWINDSYIGPAIAITVREWLNQNGSDP